MCSIIVLLNTEGTFIETSNRTMNHTFIESIYLTTKVSRHRNSFGDALQSSYHNNPSLTNDTQTKTRAAASVTLTINSRG